MSSFCSFLIINFILSFLVALIICNKTKYQYKPCLMKNKKGEIINLHELYHPFSSLDKQNFFMLWFEGFFTLIIKSVFSLLIAIAMIIHLNIIPFIYKKTDTNEKQFKKLKNIIAFYSKIFLYMNGIKVNYKKVNCEKVYKKYLGEDYNFKDDKYSMVISNHTGFFEVVICMMLYGGGFIATKEVADYYFVGKIAKAIHCLFIDRTSEKERLKIFEQIEERQKKFYDKKIFTPLILFPEGTTTSGRCILKFKKGAFYALLPLKPLIINIYQESDYHLSTGIISVVLVFFKNLLHTIEPMYVIDMPVIKPTKYMFEKYKDISNEKWEIYAEVVRKIYCEIGNLKESNLRKRDNEIYLKAIYNGIY